MVQDIVSIEGKLCHFPINILANNRVWYTNDSTLEIFPGANPFTAYKTTPSTPSIPIDRFATHVRLSAEKNVFRVFSREYEIIINKDQQPRDIRDEARKLVGKISGLVKSSAISTELLERVKRTLCQLQIIVEDASVYCGPLMLPDYILEHINSKQSFILDQDLVILPDYSNIGENIHTTIDMYVIKIGKDSKILLRDGGAIGNINIQVLEGELVINCNCDLEIPECVVETPMDNKLLSHKRFLEGGMEG